MSTTHEEIQIDLDAVDEAAKKGTKDPAAATTQVVDPAAAAAADKAPLKTEDGLEKLKKQLEEERSLRIAADRRADQASESEARARGEVHGSQLDLVTNAITTVKQANDSLKKEYVEALTAQDFNRAADIQLDMSSNAAKLLALESGKKQLETQKPRPVQRQPQDMVEEFANRCTPLSAAWVRAHPEYVRDSHKNRLMLAAHELALAQDLKADSDEYFEAIEKTLNLRKPVTNGNGNGNGHDPDPDLEIDPMADAARPKAGRAAPAAAPVTRSGNGTGARANTVTLTAQEVEFAEMNGMTAEEYAKNKIALKKEGRLN